MAGYWLSLVSSACTAESRETNAQAGKEAGGARLALCASEGAPACDRNAIPALHHLDMLVKARKMQPAHDESPALSLAASARAAVSDASSCTRLGLVLARARKRFMHTQHIGAEGETEGAPTENFSTPTLCLPPSI